MKAKQFAQYPLVVIEFDDHATLEGYGKSALSPVKCVATGFLVKEDKQAYYLCYWISDAVKNDDSLFSIVVKHPGLKITKAKI